MWEFNDQIDTDMGQAMVQPALGLTPDGKWRVAFGNGFNSASNHAILFVRDLWSGAVVAKVDTGVGSAATPNGLSSATIVDTDGDGAGDTIYAGDYLGNMWKFVYSASGPSKWVVGNGGSPIFKAVDKNSKAQSITSGVYTVANPLGGTMVEFGTGRYLSTADSDPLNPPNVDTIYSIWDAALPSDTPCTQTPIATPVRGDLQQQSITGFSAGYISSTQTAFDFRCTTTGKMGWFIDLTFVGTAGKDLLSGNRVLAAPAVILGTLLVNTFQPEGNICVPGGNNYLMELDALSGAANYSETGGSGLPTPAAGSSTGGTLIGAGPPQGSPMPVVQIPTPPVIAPINCAPGAPGCAAIPAPAGSNDCKWTLPNPANKSIQTPVPCGRVSWRQLR
jgi:type IV pilus assembly protein PilY1